MIGLIADVAWILWDSDHSPIPTKNSLPLHPSGCSGWRKCNLRRSTGTSPYSIRSLLKYTNSSRSLYTVLRTLSLIHDSSTYLDPYTTALHRTSLTSRCTPKSTGSHHWFLNYFTVNPSWTRVHPHRLQSRFSLTVVPLQADSISSSRPLHHEPRSTASRVRNQSITSP